MKRMKTLIRTCLASALLLLTLTGCGGASQETTTSGGSGSSSTPSAGKLTVVDWGGANTQARIDGIITPFEEATGIDVTVVTPSDYAKLISMVENNSTEWDVMNCDTYWGVFAGNQGYLESMDYDIIQTKIDEEVQLEHVMGAEIYTTIISWSTRNYDETTAPQNWEDFFDLENFPGKRAIWKYPVTVLEAALLADGVAMDDLYPLDLDRAFAKLDTIKDSTIWWSAGAEPAQMLSNGEAEFALAWSGRIATAAEEGSPIDMTYTGGIQIAAGWVVPKGAPNSENAMAFIEFASQAEQQLAFSQSIPYGSTNPDAVALMDSSLQESLGQTQAQLQEQIYLDNEYWAEYLSDVTERFNTWLVTN